MAGLKPITIAGGGLAGLSLGLGLRKHGVPVELHEAGSYPRHRVCGEFISGLRDGVIDRLDLGDSLSDALQHRSTTWYVRDRKVLEAALPEPARGISRYALDERLGRLLIANGGRVIENSRIRTPEAEGLVWAAGRRLEKSSDWLGLKAHFSGYPLRDQLEMHAGNGAYLGISPVEEGYVNVCGLFKRRDGISASGAELLKEYLRQSGLGTLAGVLDSSQFRPDSFVGVSAIAFGRQAQSQDVCALGDAEWVIPPFTGNGMTMAFESADGALPHLVEFAEGRIEWSAALARIRHCLQRRFRDRIRVASCLHPFLYTRTGQFALSLMSRTHLLPFNLLYRGLR